MKCIDRQPHSSHKIPDCNALGLPFPIQFAEFIPIYRDRLSARVLALSLCNLNALTLTLFELLTFRLRERRENRQHEFSCRRIRINFFFVTDQRYFLVGQRINDVQQILCRTPQTADTLLTGRLPSIKEWLNTSSLLLKPKVQWKH